LQQRVGQRHRVAHSTPECDVQLADKRDPHETSPRHTASDSSSPRSNFRYLVMRNEVVGPLTRCFYRK